MSQQAGLFQDEKLTMRSPLCSYVRHCGAKAELSEPEDCGGCINTNVRCLVCHATGVISARKDLA